MLATPRPSRQDPSTFADFRTMTDPEVAAVSTQPCTGFHEDARRLGCRATGFVQMLEQLGGVETARRLLASPTPQAGFTTLWEMGEPTLAVEYHVLRAEFTTLFTAAEKNESRRRLEAIGFGPPTA